MNKKNVIYISAGVFLGLVVGFFVGVYYKNEKSQSYDYGYLQKQIVPGAFNDLPKYFVDARVLSVAKDNLLVFEGMNGGPNIKLGKNEVATKINLSNREQIFLRRPKTQEEIYGKDIDQKIKNLEMKLNDGKLNDSTIKRQIFDLKKQGYGLMRQEVDKILSQTATTSEQQKEVEQKIFAINSKYIYEKINLSDIKEGDNIKIYTDDEIDHAKEINALRIEVIK